MVLRNKQDRRAWIQLFVLRNTNVLVPDIRMHLDESPHEFDALWVLKDNTLNLVGSEQVLCALKGSIFTDDHFGNLVEKRSSGTHDAGTERADQDQFVPVSAAPGIADTGYFCVGGGIARLDSQVVAAGDDLAAEIGQD